MYTFLVEIDLITKTHPNTWIQDCISCQFYEGELLVDCTINEVSENCYHISMELQLIKSPDNWLSETIQENVFAHKGESLDNLIITLA